jgi:hypothetical protein
LFTLYDLDFISDIFGRMTCSGLTLALIRSSSALKAPILHSCIIHTFLCSLTHSLTNLSFTICISVLLVAFLYSAHHVRRHSHHLIPRFLWKNQGKARCLHHLRWAELTHTRTHSLTHSLSLSLSLTHSLTHSYTITRVYTFFHCDNHFLCTINHSRTHSPTHSSTHHSFIAIIQLPDLSSLWACAPPMVV